MVSAVIVSAGRGTRMKADKNKVFLELMGKTILEHTVSAFFDSPSVDEIIIVTGEEDIKKAEEMFKNSKKPLKVVLGGAERFQSVLNGINASSGDIVAIHDGARALITPSLIEEVIKDAKCNKASALGVLCKDTIKIVSDDGFIEYTTKRSNTYQIQTPQVFYKDIIKKAHEERDDFKATDDCSLVENLNIPVKVVLGSYENIKITTPEDIILAEGILRDRK